MYAKYYVFFFVLTQLKVCTSVSALSAYQKIGNGIVCKFWIYKSALCIFHRLCLELYGFMDCCASVEFFVSESVIVVDDFMVK